LLKIIVAVLAFGFASTAMAGDTAVITEKGVSAYRLGDLFQAKELLTPAAMAGDARAKRYVAYIMLDTAAPKDVFDPYKGVALLTDAAKAGDYAALIKLEELRLGGRVHAPSLADMIAIETHRAQNGDPIADWRLAKRYEEGDGVAPSETETARWLEVAAQAPVSEFPKAGEAAFRLCEYYAQSAASADVREARRWCARAAKNGDAAAAMMLGRLAARG